MVPLQYDVGGVAHSTVELKEDEVVPGSRNPLRPDDTTLGRQAWEENKSLWAVALPLIFIGTSALGITFINKAFMKRIGVTELAVFAIVCTVLTPFTNAVLMGTVNALQSLCGQSYGAKQYQMLGVYLQHSWIILFACAIVLLPVYVFTKPLLVALGHDPKITAVVGTILIWYIPVMFSYVWSIPLQMYLQAQSKNVIIAYFAIASLGLHLALSWLVTVKFQLGIAGVMGSMVICTWIPVFGQLAFVFFGGCPLTWTGFSSAALTRKGLVEIINLSLSSGAVICTELLYNITLLLMTRHMKGEDNVVRALSICLKINGCVTLFSTAFQAAVGVRVANELGAGSARRAKFSVANAVVTCFLIGAVLFVISLLFGGRLAYIFTNDQEVVNAFADLVPLLAYSILFYTVQPVLSGVAVGAGWQSVLFIIASCYLLGIPLGALLGYVKGFSVMGMWSGILFGKLVQIFLLLCKMLTTDWEEQIKIVQERLNALNTDENQGVQASGGTVELALKVGIP